MDNTATALDDDDYGEDISESTRASYLYMELKSTSQFRDIDIDRMLEHTTLDDFMRGLYINKSGQARSNKAAG